MKLRDLTNIFWRRKWIILVTLIVTMIVVVAGTLLATPIYSTNTTLRIATAANGSINYSDYMYADRLINTYVKMSTTKPVFDELKSRLDLTKLPPIEVQTIPNTELIQIRVDYKDPNAAANIANTLADILISQSSELYTGGGDSSLEILSQQVDRMEEEVNQSRQEYLDLSAKKPNDAAAIQSAKQTMDLKQELYAQTLDQYEQTRLRDALLNKSITVVDPAVSPLSPSKPNKILNLGLGLIVGVLGGLGLAFLFENLDSALYTTDQIEELIKLPNIGTIPDSGVLRRFSSVNGNNPYTEAFRRIRTTIFNQNTGRLFKTILITSPEPGEGKSTIISDLGFVLAQNGYNVVIVDGDLRIPKQQTIFELPNELGLANVLSDEVSLEEAVQDTKYSGLHVLTSGPIPDNPSELLDTSRMSDVISTLRKNYDLVLVDSPAILAVADSAILAPQVDGVIMVVCRATSRREDVLSSCRQMENSKARMIGFILNKVEQNGGYYYHSSKPSRFNKLLPSKTRLKNNPN